ncbi:Redoxin AhpC TSA family putativelike Thioredoxin like domain [Trypanosoma vivax]|uniref:Putative tryparedoxin n=1 Tax=Trypanosoma vivax (strain Y486) TaxID=1055687 RepID=G0TT54_TRYVY|nr:putative tryparedoxin [Trypanosoma vivax]KAH8619592.1 Redoxin AhpC TSA family putativelike Thioredoxin like domain [Trypanosoma vivax]CCC47135.1 putative tryparedoxin [Trypanosoma vivax Y486]
MSGLSKFIPSTIKLLSKKDQVPLSDLAGKVVLLYFSASWCPPCRGFTPTLSEFYEKYHASKNFEVIFVSWDEEEADFNGYYSKMPWLAIPFTNAKERESLGKTFKVESIPTVIAVNADSGETISTTGRVKLIDDPEGKNFPWAS